MMKKIDENFWRGKKVFLTGHTGFKGSWLSIWLMSMGADVYGYALEAPTNPSLFRSAAVANGMNSIIGDVRDYGSLFKAIKECRPEIVIHMAAQPLVRLSYEQPIETYATNVMGTVNLLEAIRSLHTVRAIVNVTTDKCYENKEWCWGYRENEAMGGYDPYSSSKGCSELVTSAYSRSYFEKGTTALASARAGNVIGGGDWAADRLVPDILKSIESGRPVQIRNPNAIRPWQHVLEPLSGYLMLSENLYKYGGSFVGAWNFGPNDDDAKPVSWIVENLIKQLNGKYWEYDNLNHPHEANYLKLDISKAKNHLGWTPRWNLEFALTQISNWHRAWSNKEDMRKVCIEQITLFNEMKI